ncbi:MAG: diaminopimelate decarboxylase family protein [Candidatus Heimdallarchaeota archaeon]
MNEKTSFEWEELSKKIGSLEYKMGVLEIEGIPYKQFLREDQTPIFVFSQERFKDNISNISNAFQEFFEEVYIAYALKANTLSYVLAVASSVGCWAEVMSAFEMELAQTNRFAPSTMIFNGPAKTIEELQRALAMGVRMINIDSFAELKDIERLMKKTGAHGEEPRTQLGIRLHPLLEEALEKRALVRKTSKLGLDPARATKILKYAAKSKVLDISAIHIHIGTQQATPALHEGVASFVQEFVIELQKDNIEINTINLGGGFASRYLIESTGHNMRDFAEKIHSAMSKIETPYVLILEPGRFLVGDSFVVLTKIIREKKNWGRNWLLVDAGAHFLIPLRFSTFDVIPTRTTTRSSIKEIGGPLCLPTDRLQGVKVNFETKEGDILAILNTGAYTISMSEQFGYPRPAIYTVNEERIMKLRRREKLADWTSLDV